MKRITHQHLLLFIALIWNGLGGAVLAQTVPPLSQIVSNVVEATRPTEAYSVTVNQTLTPLATNTAPVVLATKAAVAQLPTVQTFDVTYKPTKRKWVSHRVPQQKASAKRMRPNTKNPSDQSVSPRITIDLEPFLESLLSSNQVTVVEEVLNGRTCYKLNAQSGGSSTATLWVDAEHWYVSKAIVYMMNQKFAEVKCQHRKVNGRWLFSDASIAHTLDGSHAHLKYGEYKRSSKAGSK